MNSDSLIYDFEVWVSPLNQYVVIPYFCKMALLKQDEFPVQFVVANGYGTRNDSLYIDSPEIRRVLETEGSKLNSVIRYAKVLSKPQLHNETWRKLNKIYSREEWEDRFGSSKTR